MTKSRNRSSYSNNRAYPQLSLVSVNRLTDSSSASDSSRDSAQVKNEGRNSFNKSFKKTDVTQHTSPYKLSFSIKKKNVPTDFNHEIIEILRSLGGKAGRLAIKKGLYYDYLMHLEHDQLLNFFERIQDFPLQCYRDSAVVHLLIDYLSSRANNIEHCLRNEIMAGDKQQSLNKELDSLVEVQLNWHMRSIEHHQKHNVRVLSGLYLSLKNTFHKHFDRISPDRRHKLSCLLKKKYPNWQSSIEENEPRYITHSTIRFFCKTTNTEPAITAKNTGIETKRMNYSK